MIKHTFSNELIDKISNNDASVVNDEMVKDISVGLGANEITKNQIHDYYLQLTNGNNSQITNGKKLLNNGKNNVPSFTAIDFLTLGITYLIKLAIQGGKDYNQFKQNEPAITNNCARNHIDYVSNNKNDGIKDITKGIALYHEIDDLKKKIKQNNGNNANLMQTLKKKTDMLSNMCKKNKTLDTLINSDKTSCAMANGLFHVGIIASRINNNGKKEFFIIDQGGRKVPGSGFPSDDELSKSGINVMQVYPTNGMCVSTAESGLHEISNHGLDNYLMTYANVVKHTTRDNPSYYKEERMGQKMIIGNVNDVKNDNIKSGAISSYTRSKGMRILL